MPFDFTEERHLHLFGSTNTNFNCDGWRLYKSEVKITFNQLICPDPLHSHQQVRHLGEVNHQHLILNLFYPAQPVILCPFLGIPCSDRTYAHHLAVFVGHFNTDGSLPGMGANDTACPMRPNSARYHLPDFWCARFLCRHRHNLIQKNWQGPMVALMLCSILKLINVEMILSLFWLSFFLRYLNFPHLNFIQQLKRVGKLVWAQIQRGIVFA